MKSILVISDLHAPYSHPDTCAFLQALKKKYKPDRVILTGDEADKHAISFHDHDPDLPSSGDELELAIRCLEPIYKLFPKADILESNHGSLAYRKAVHHGLSRKYLREYGDVLRAPVGWKWHFDLTVKVGTNEIYFHHGLSSNVLRLVERRGVCVVQGHFHNSFCIQYTANPHNLLRVMTVGCLIDNKALSFAYNRNNLARPVIGCGVIVNGHPKLLPMVLGANGSWTGYVP